MFVYFLHLHLHVYICVNIIIDVFYVLPFTDMDNIIDRKRSDANGSHIRDCSLVGHCNRCDSLHCSLSLIHYLLIDTPVDRYLLLVVLSQSQQSSSSMRTPPSVR